MKTIPAPLRRTAVATLAVGALVLGLSVTATAASAVSNCPFRTDGDASPQQCGPIKVPTSAALTVDRNPAPQGAAVTFTALVAQQPGHGVPSGSVTFSSIDPTTQNRTAIATEPLVNGTATWTTSTLPVGVDGIYAESSGDYTYDSAWATYDEEIDAVPQPPVVAAISPAVGPSTGGTTVTITGAKLDAATKITIGKVAIASFSCPSSTTCNFVTPAGARRQAVRVTTPFGRSAMNPADRFAYKVPRG